VGGLDRSDGIPRRYRTLVLALLLFAAPLLVGGVHVRTALVLSFGGLLFGGLIVFHTRRSGRSLVVPWAGWGLAVLLLGTALQLIPLPSWLLAGLAADSSELYAFVLRDLPAELAGAWRSISLVPSSTAREVIELAGLTALVVALANTHRRSEGRDALVFLLAFGGGLVAVVALSGLALESPDYLGIYEPQGSWDPGVAHGPFVNPNHLAGYLGLTAFAAFGFAAGPREPRGQGAFAAALGALSLVGLVLSGSRGAMIAGAAILPLFLLLQSAALHRQKPRGALLAAALGLVLLGAIFFPQIERSLRFVGSSAPLSADQKIQSWTAVLDQIQANPWVGTGRGAYAQAHTRYKVLPVNLRFTHAENEPLQALADWGVPLGGAAVVGTLLLAAWLIRRRSQRATDVGLVCGLLFLGLHNLVDFNLEFLGVGIPAAIALGLLSRPSRAAPLPAPPRALRLALLAGVPVLALLALPLALDDRGPVSLSRLQQLSRQPGVARDQLLRAAHEALDAQPAEYLVPLLTARGMMTDDRPRAEFPPGEVARWLNLVAFLNPTAPGGHLLTARLLWATGHREQALSEYRRALRDGARLVPLIGELLRRDVPLAGLQRVLPPRKEVLQVLAGQLVDHGRWQDADEVFRSLLRFPSTRKTAAAHRASLARQHRSPELALVRARDLVAIAPEAGGSHHFLGLALARLGQTGEALRAFERATSLAPRRDEAWADRLELLARLGDWDAIGLVLEEFKPYSSRSGRAAGLYHSWEGRIALHHDNLAQAIQAYDAAAAAELRSCKSLYILARLRERVGDPTGAAAALREAAARGGDRAATLLEALRRRHPTVFPPGTAPGEASPPPARRP